MIKLWKYCLAAVFFSAVTLSSGVSYAEKTVGVILTGVIPYYEKIHATFEKELKGTGAGDVKLLVQKPAPNAMAWINAARKAVAVGVDVVVVYGGPSAVKNPHRFCRGLRPRGTGIKWQKHDRHKLEGAHGGSAEEPQVHQEVRKTWSYLQQRRERYGGPGKGDFKARGAVQFQGNTV
jgi:hypothetical protein